MLHSARRVAGRRTRRPRCFHTTPAPSSLQSLQAHNASASPQPSSSRPPTEIIMPRENKTRPSTIKQGQGADQAKRNELGVQLLSRTLHSQIFRNLAFPQPPKPYIQIARDHLLAHGLDPALGSVLPDIGFALPPLQGDTIDQHFFQIGNAAAQPWLRLAAHFASTDPPPRPEHWHIQPGWTKYHHSPDGASYSESVPAPEEDMLSFDVETLPAYHNFAVMACAMSESHWYSWISPWLLGESDHPNHLIPLGNPNHARMVVGHNVSYDRARVLEEYDISGTKTRFLDTMALHVAVTGISSHQRPAWTKYRKNKETAKEMKEEAIAAAVDLIADLKEKSKSDDENQDQLQNLRRQIEESLPQLEADYDGEDGDAEASSKRWEDITSANSLADVAKLHCGINVGKEIRNDFMTHTPQEIAANLNDYLDYCAEDVRVTHAVYRKVLPAFLRACPNPVSFAGILTMGSSLLPVNQEWDKYLINAEKAYRDLDDKVRKKLVALADEAKDMVDTHQWENDVWLSQLDWTPKSVGKSRGVDAVVRKKSTKISKPRKSAPEFQTWYNQMKVLGPFHKDVKTNILPYLLRLSHQGRPLRRKQGAWYYLDHNNELQPFVFNDASLKVQTLLGKRWGNAGLKKGILTTLREEDRQLALALTEGQTGEELEQAFFRLAEEINAMDPEVAAKDPWLSQLQWPVPEFASEEAGQANLEEPTVDDAPPVIWPKWYWELTRPKKGLPPGTVDITVRNRVAPLLLRLSWLGWPLFHSREHGWIYRVPPNAKFETRQRKVQFFDDADKALSAATERGYTFYKLPHKDGEDANVGSPLGKTFMKYAQDGTLKGPGDGAGDALDMNAQCSYWISSRDRILKQMVVWQDQNRPMGFQPPTTTPTTTSSESSSDEKWGIILPQVITMGTVTRRAIEKTWLTASNAKKNRIGSELKALVRAPEGYAIVGADVDSEELWISSAMGDAQFGLHGATALGWMTLEGTKSAGTDLHSKTANILGISRDQAKIFNYSRIYGAGMRHAVLLLLQGNPSLLVEDAQRQAEKLYASTKGKNTYRTDIFGRRFWFGGTESFVFNKLEEIAMSDTPRTPALGCGITYALSKEYLPAGFGTDYMTSRINWVVQSSGVDYLHLLIVSMDHLIQKYDIHARYLISVHDELRYLVKEADRYRAALALQIANLWTRSQFAFRLGMDDLPQGVAFFSAVDIDRVLRKEVDLPCVTPSQAVPIPPGEALDIAGILEKTSGGSLWRDGRAMGEREEERVEIPSGTTPLLEGYEPPNCLIHRASSAHFLRAQATFDFGEVRRMAELASGLKYTGGIGRLRSNGRQRKSFTKAAMAEDY